jgi:uncharacterized delta-60 repeat protein
MGYLVFISFVSGDPESLFSFHKLRKIRLFINTILSMLKVYLLSVFSLSLLYTSNVHAQNDSDLDLSFHGNGKHTFTFHPGINSVYDVDQQGPNGFLILSDHYITRVDSSGNIDLSFANNGVLDVSPLSPNDMAVGNNRIYIGGWDTQYNPQVQCFFPNGSPDNSFGTNSISNPSIPQEQIIYDLKVDPLGRILGAGRTNTSNNHDMMMFRLLGDGSLDTSFGVSGLFTYDGAGNNDEIWSIGFQSDGKIICAGENGLNFNATAVVRLNTDGSIDGTFATNGVFTYSVIGRNTHLDDVLILADDRIRITGPYDNTTNYKAYVIGLQANGSLDFSWAANGLYTHPSIDRANKLLLQPDGKILVAGIDQVSFSRRNDFAIIRFNPNGTLDNTWGGNGSETYDMLDNNDNLRSIFQLSSGKIFGVGSVRDDPNNKFIGLIRLHNSASPPCTPDQSSESTSICLSDSTLIFGQWENVPGTYPQTFTNISGCDSIHSILLSHLTSQQTIDIQQACSSYTWIDGNTYFQSTNAPTVTLTNQSGCDSTVHLNLTILQQDSTVDMQSACGSYPWINGVTYFQSIVGPQVTLTNSAGCDSIVTLNLTLNPIYSLTDSLQACGSYTWIDGVTYTQSTQGPTVFLTSSKACDSTLVLDLEITQIDTSLQQSGTTLTVTQQADNWQWIDCSNGQLIVGANGAAFNATSNGSFAALIGLNGCVDTSRCVDVQNIGLWLETKAVFSAYPNPHSGQLSLYLPSNYQYFMLEIVDLSGRILQRIEGSSEELRTIKLEMENALLLLRLWGDDQYLGSQEVIRNR